MKNNNHGSALTLVLLCAVVIGTITASILMLANTQRRLNLSKELQLQANTTAEASADYAYSFLINEIKANALAGATSVPASGAKSFTLPTDSLDYLTDDLAAPSGFTGRTSLPVIATPEIKILAPSEPVRFLVDPKDPANANDPNVNQWVTERTVPVIAKVSVSQGPAVATAYVRKGVSVREIFLFQHAIFFSGQLQLHRGFRTLGDVHANGPLLINAHVGDQAKYTGFISTASKFYRGSTIDEGGKGGDAYGYTKLNSAGEVDVASSSVLISPKNNTTLTLFTGKVGGSDNYKVLPLDFDSRKANWKDKAIEDFKGHLKDTSHQAPQLTPIGSSGYRLDDASTSGTNEFNNGPYSLIEPLLPAGHAARKPAAARDLNLEATARLVLRVEVRRDLLTTGNPHTSTVVGTLKLYSSANPTGRAESSTPVSSHTKDNILVPSGTNALGEKVYTAADLKLASNIADAFVVKAYWNKGNASALSLTPITLPRGVVGAANTGITGIASTTTVPGKGTYQKAGVSGSGLFEPYRGPIDVNTGTNPYGYTYDSANGVVSGLHDARLGRGVDLLTIDVAKLKAVMEADIATLTDPDELDDLAFRNEFTPGWTNWKGVVYVEFPTSLDIDFDPDHFTDAPVGGVGDPHPTDPLRNTFGPYESYAFEYGAAELRHPDRWSATDSRQNRTDKIVPIAPELRRYPATFTEKDIFSRYNAIPALQIINGGQLPNPTGSPGFTIATNAPIYLIGSYNSDGNYATGTNILSTSADAYATADVGEVPAALFCDMFTVLSDKWRTSPNPNRLKSHLGWGSDSEDRPVPLSGTKRIEIGACIATGEYPIFEFFFHTLEDYEAFNPSGINPIIVKGSVVGMFHSEIQHIKQAYGRVKEKDIQVYWNDHGSHAFTSVRYHKDLMDGKFPPGTPRAQVTYQVGYRLLRAGDADDVPELQTAGFIP